MLKLELSLDEINGILGALAKRPFEEVADLINKIKTQAIPQLEEPKKNEKAKSDK